MTPKEQAKDLVDEYRGLAHSDFHNQTGYDEAQKEENQRQCALIVVDKMINMCKLYHNHNIIVDGKIYTELTIDYWQQVKQEIENL
jgi:hypothetical protein